MTETTRAFFRKRFKNQLSNLMTSGTVLFLIAGGILMGTIAGIHTAKFAQDVLGVGESAKSLIVIALTIAGFVTGLFLSYGLSPRLLQASFFAKPTRNPEAIALLQEILVNSPQIQADFYEIDDEEYPLFGPNVVVSGFTRGRGWLKPAVFAAKSVLRTCPKAEIHAILAHEMAHLNEWHLLKRIRGALATFLIATLFTSFVIVGMQWSGYAQVATLVATISGIVPAILTWMQTKVQIRSQEKEADQKAIETFGAAPEALLTALKRLTTDSGRVPHPIVEERIQILTRLLDSENKAAFTRSAA